MKYASIIGLAVITVLLAWAATDQALARHDHHGENRHREHHDEDRQDNKNCAAMPSAPATYALNCGACHMAYPAPLLPARSWTAIMGGLSSHFGATVAVNETDEPVIRQYLAANAADTGSSRLGGQIMTGIGAATPERITELPYIRHAHEELGQMPDTLRDCASCHDNAAVEGFRHSAQHRND